MPFEDSPEGQTNFCLACEAEAHKHKDKRLVHNCGKEKTCGALIHTRGLDGKGLYCAAPLPCKLHPNSK